MAPERAAAPSDDRGRAADHGEAIDHHRTDHHRQPADVCADGHAAASLRRHRVAVSLRQVALDLACLADALDDADEAAS